MADLKKVYQSVTEEENLSNLMAFKEAWGKQYPSCLESWGRIGISCPHSTHIRRRSGKSYIQPISSRDSTGSSERLQKTNCPLPTTIPCAKSCIWHPKTLSNTGLRVAKIGIRLSASWESCLETARPGNQTIVWRPAGRMADMADFPPLI